MLPDRSKVLVIEDESDVKDLIVLHLKRESLDVRAVENGEEGLRLLQSEKFHLLVLDWMLPGLSGLEICKRVRAQSQTLPILMVTARADTADVVLGLEVGADDYLTKPFEIPILLARVRTLLRRGQRLELPHSPVQKYQVGALSMDVEAHRVTCHDQPIELTPSEFKLLSALLAHPGRVLSRERLIDLVQGQGVAVIDRAIDTHVFGLRKKLGDCSEVIETIRGVGYRVRG